MNITFADGVHFAAHEWKNKAARREPLAFFWVPNNYGLWCSPDATQFCKPIPTLGHDLDATQLWEYFSRPRKTRRLHSKEPCLAFWPMQWLWNGVFESLNVTPTNVPVSKYAKDFGYHLAPQRFQQC